jgi:hypothetical protein|nr:MAG TPA: hypothetical protein [Caudoviricetes sp.]
MLLIKIVTCLAIEEAKEKVGLFFVKMIKISKINTSVIL